jgi:hypothetical protein
MDLAELDIDAQLEQDQRIADTFDAGRSPQQTGAG